MCPTSARPGNPSTCHTLYTQISIHLMLSPSLHPMTVSVFLQLLDLYLSSALNCLENDTYCTNQRVSPLICHFFASLLSHITRSTCYHPTLKPQPHCSWIIPSPFSPTAPLWTSQHAQQKPNHFSSVGCPALQPPSTMPHSFSLLLSLLYEPDHLYQ